MVHIIVLKILRLITGQLIFQVPFQIFIFIIFITVVQAGRLGARLNLSKERCVIVQVFGLQSPILKVEFEDEIFKM